MNNKKLNNKILFEYLYIIISGIFIVYLLPILADSMIGDNRGLDGVGQALAVVFLLRIIKRLKLNKIISLYDF